MQTNRTQGTALITGASSGIGAEFARALAGRGYNLILVARRLDWLQALAAELTYGDVCAEAVAADLTRPDDVARLERCIAGREDLSLLVNNAGFGAVGTFGGLPLERTLDMIDVHVAATTRLCYAALPDMLKRGKGGIINVSSVAAFMPTTVNYCATKAYINVFSEALQMELRVAGSGIRVQALCPGLTHTEFHSAPEFKTDGAVTRAPDWMWMSAADVVKVSLRALGRGPVIVIPGWRNRLMVALMRSPLGGLAMQSMKRE